MRRGPKRRLGVEDEFWKLVRDGGATGAACVAVGIGRKTGYRWRSENGGSPPVRLQIKDNPRGSRIKICGR
jgi:IS30 family transposase